MHAHQICWCYLCLIFFGRRKIDNSMDFTNRKRKKYLHFIQGKARDWKSRGKCVFNRSFIRFSSLFATSFLFEHLKLFYLTIENTCTNTYIISSNRFGSLELCVWFIEQTLYANKSICLPSMRLSNWTFQLFDNCSNGWPTNSVGIAKFFDAHNKCSNWVWPRLHGWNLFN